MKKTQPFFINRQKELGKLNGYIEEMVSGQKATLLFSQEEKVKAEFSKMNKELTKSAIVAEALSGWMGPVMNFINNLTYLILAVTGGYFIVSGKNITVGMVFSIILYMRSFNRPINDMLNLANTIQSALAGAERVFEVMDEEFEQDKEDAVDIDTIEGEVTLENVEFSYSKDKKILKGIDLHASKGKTVAIVGPTGSGKTTVINLLNRFYDIDSGKITIDNKNIDEFTIKSLRKSIAIVLQDTYLFSTTVRENIRFGRLDATDEEVEAAAKLAHVHHFIKQLPDGYDTVLSDNGSDLSQGQRQLLAIARAMISNCSILILDEATSSIDTRTEIDIQKAMTNLMKDKTTFIIAHRLSTIKNADEIIAIKDGCIIEKGNHDELLDKDGFYANLYNSQFRQGLSI
jgi:ATP-binding cassette subfamily B protein